MRRIHAALSAAVILLGCPWVAAAEPSRLEARWADRNTVIVTAEFPDGCLEVTGAAGLYGHPGEGFVRIGLEGCASTSAPGQPQLPFISAVIDAPHRAGVELEVASGGHRETGVAGRVMPALGPVPKVPGAVPVFSADPWIYGADCFWPPKLAEASDASSAGGLARGHRLVSVRLYPVAYNPVAGRLRLHTRLTATVRFKDPDWPATRTAVERNLSPAWEELVGRLCAATPKAPFPGKSDEVFFDIFHGQSFQAAAARLADWKSRLGHKVRLACAGGWTSQALRDTIRLRQPLATYVLLISDPSAGGLDSLPPSGMAGGGGFRTDLYYAEADGSGYLPDLFLGRLSVRTPAEAEAAVDKIISYQQADFGSAGTGWLSRALFVAGYDAGFQWLGRSTNRYCHDILRREGYAVVDTLVMANGEEQGRIVDRLNQGRAWTVYTAHGSPTAWNVGQTTNFTVDEVVSQVQNAGMPAMVSGHCCQSNNFMYAYGDCFGETWPKLAGRAAVAYLGSVPLTYWDEDDWLQRRYFDAIYDSVPGSPGLRMPEPGRYVQYGLYWIDLNTSTSLKQYYFEAYHLLGDPSAAVWTGSPGSLSADHPQAVSAGADSFRVAVSDSATGQPVAGAMACAWSRADRSLHSTGLTGPDGVAALPLGPLSVGDTLLVAASARGFRPRLSQALVLSKLSVELSSRTIVVNVPTGIEMEVTDPDSGNAPVCSLDVFASYNGAAGQQVAVTGLDGRASFILSASEGGYVALAGIRWGREMFRDTVRVLAPDAFGITRIYPNPSPGRASFDFQVPKSCQVEICVYDVLGRRVRTVFAGQLGIGFHRMAWDGLDDRGRACPSGVYFGALRSDGPDSWPPRRLVLIK